MVRRSVIIRVRADVIAQPAEGDDRLGYMDARPTNRWVCVAY